MLSCRYIMLSVWWVVSSYPEMVFSSFVITSQLSFHWFYHWMLDGLWFHGKLLMIINIHKMIDFSILTYTSFGIEVKGWYLYIFPHSCECTWKISFFCHLLYLLVATCENPFLPELHSVQFLGWMMFYLHCNHPFSSWLPDSSSGLSVFLLSFFFWVLLPVFLWWV